VHLDPIMPYLVGAVLAVLILGLLLRSIRQPYVIGYLIAGIVLGPHGFALITNYGYQMTIAVISISLLISPPWIMFIKLLLKINTLEKQ
jgi:monovalent cation:H+ antiporter-2, CPA2 family